jgi:nucleotide-binding universal stress UspA family protein
MSTIVVATDGSAAAQEALAEGIELAHATGDTLSVITVWRALQGDFGLAYPSAALLGDLLEAERRHAEQTLADARARAEEAGVLVVTELLTGDPADQICRHAERRRARLIALGTHGHGPALSLLTGSVSGAVIRRSPCPVLVVRAPQPQEVPATADELAESR